MDCIQEEEEQSDSKFEISTPCTVSAKNVEDASILLRSVSGLLISHEGSRDWIRPIAACCLALSVGAPPSTGGRATELSGRESCPTPTQILARDSEQGMVPEI